MGRHPQAESNRTTHATSGPRTANGTNSAPKCAKANASTLVVFWKFFDSEAEQQQQDGTQDTPTRPRCFARACNVFNAQQVDRYETKLPDQLPESHRIAQADAFFNAIPATIEYGGDWAHYSPEDDYLQIPPFGQFKSADKHANTLCHELTHWAGAKSRLNRDLSGRFGDAS